MSENYIISLSLLLVDNTKALRAAFLEKQNVDLKVTLKSLNMENRNIRTNVETLMEKIKAKEDKYPFLKKY